MTNSDKCAEVKNDRYFIAVDADVAHVILGALAVAQGEGIHGIPRAAGEFDYERYNKAEQEIVGHLSKCFPTVYEFYKEQHGDR
jgi:hypothetical protein